MTVRMTALSNNLPAHGHDIDLHYGDVARIAEEAAVRGWRFAGAETVEFRSSYWILSLHAADGTPTAWAQ